MKVVKFEWLNYAILTQEDSFLGKYLWEKLQEADVEVCNNLALVRWKIPSVWQKKMTERCL